MNASILAAGLALCSVAASAQSVDQAASPAPPLTKDTPSASAGQDRPAYSCMSRHVTKGGGPAFDFTIPVPATHKAEITAKGFAPGACTSHATDLASFKQEMCMLAEGNEAVQRRLEEVLGVDAVKLCAVARTLLPDAPDTKAQ